VKLKTDVISILIGIYVNSCQQYSHSEYCSNWKCSNRLLTCIVITILPIAITSTLICIFMMQKTNLHEYAIYTFVVFCVAFVFPFALFFFTVILNKVNQFLKFLVYIRVDVELFKKYIICRSFLDYGISQYIKLKISL